jgi:hypothetical protein
VFTVLWMASPRETTYMPDHDGNILNSSPTTENLFFNNESPFGEVATKDIYMTGAILE